MYAMRIPQDVAAAIDECWPDGVIEEFDRDESYFHDIHAALQRDLRKISAAQLVWQTEAENARAYWDTDSDGDDADDLPPDGPDYQSYHVFFLAPKGSEFEFETDTESLEEPEDFEDPDSEVRTVIYPGRGQCGCSVAVSLATPFAFVSFSEYAQFEDGSTSTPDPCNVAYFDETGKPVDAAATYRKNLGESVFAKLENLHTKIVKVLAKHGVAVLDQAIIDLPAPDLNADGDLFLEGKRLRVRDAFFFRGV
ncbi:MAG TPA: hypothetical protein VN924_21715 [Bryobacteraceae bacterium]|nr:hypothetical protein [Bryobacteraceae bacterium]